LDYFTVIKVEKMLLNICQSRLQARLRWADVMFGCQDISTTLDQWMLAADSGRNVRRSTQAPHGLETDVV